MSGVSYPQYLELPVAGGRQRYRLYGVVIHSGYTMTGDTTTHGLGEDIG